MSLRLTLFAAATLATAFGISLALGRWGAGENADLSALARALQRGQELKGHLANLWRRDEARRALAAEVIAGRMGLGEAAGHFRRLEESDPGYPPGRPRPATDDRSLREKVLYAVCEVCLPQGRYATAARCLAEAFRADPPVLGGLPTRLRYYAACAAARAGCGQGRDAADLDEAGRAGGRRQALDWLRAELEALRRLREEEPNQALTFVHNLEDWLGDPHFAGVRGPEALARLPEPERQAWHQLWADVADTLARAQGKAPPEAEADREVQPPER